MRDEPVEIHVTSDDRPTPLCDFCSSPEIVWSYPCNDFDLPEEYASGSVGDWAACEPCAEIIERIRVGPDGAAHAVDLVELASRPIDHVYPEGPPSADVLLEMGHYLFFMHGGFFRNRTGPREPYSVPTSVPN